MSAGQEMVWVYSEKGATYNRICVNGTREQFSVKGLKDICLGRNCQLSGDKFRIAAAPFAEEVDMGQFAMGKFLDSDISNLLPNGSDPDYREAMAKLGNVHLGSPVRVHHLIQQVQSELDKEAQGATFQWLYLGLFIVALGVASVIGYLGFRFYMLYRAERMLSKVSHKRVRKERVRNEWPDIRDQSDWKEYKKAAAEGFQGGFMSWSQWATTSPWMPRAQDGSASDWDAELESEEKKRMSTVTDSTYRF